jgi:D-xylose transport system substrate-binding protein
MKTPTQLLLFLSFILISCDTENKSFKVGFLLPNLESDRYKQEKIFFSDKINALGGEALILSADYDDKLQIQQAQELLAKDIEVLVVNCINQNTAAAIVRLAHENNVQVIAYDRMISNCDLDYYLSFNNLKVGKLMADYALKLKPKGNYLIIGGDKADQNAIFVKNGQLQQLESHIKSGDVKITFNVFIEDWSGDNAKYYLEKYLDLGGPVPDVILSSYDGMTTGMIEALKENNLAGNVLATGQDAELAACKNIIAGYQTMTVYKPLKPLAEKAAEICKKIINKEKIDEAIATQNNNFKEVPSIFLDPVSVDQNNIKATVIADGHLKESELF